MKKKKVIVFCSLPPQNVKLGIFIVVQRQQRNVQKIVMHVQICCFVKFAA